jgi:hypothetical protein
MQDMAQVVEHLPGKHKALFPPSPKKRRVILWPENNRGAVEELRQMSSVVYLL